MVGGMTIIALLDFAMRQGCGGIAAVNTFVMGSDPIVLER